MQSANASDTKHEFMVELIERVEENDINAVEHLLCRADIMEDMLEHGMVKSADKGYAEITRLLIAAGANANYQNTVGSTPLMVAAFRGATDVGRILIDNGAELDLVDDRGFTALMNATVKGCIEIAQLLIDNGADVNVCSRSGDTAMSIALDKGDQEMVLMLERAPCVYHVAAFEKQRRLNARTFKPKIIGRLQP